MEKDNSPKIQSETKSQISKPEPKKQTPKEATPAKPNLKRVEKKKENFTKGESKIPSTISQPSNEAKKSTDHPIEHKTPESKSQPTPISKEKTVEKPTEEKKPERVRIRLEEPKQPESKPQEETKTNGYFDKEEECDGIDKIMALFIVLAVLLIGTGIFKNILSILYLCIQLFTNLAQFLSVLIILALVAVLGFALYKLFADND